MSRNVDEASEKTELDTMTENDKEVRFFLFIRWCLYLFVSLSFLMSLFSEKKVLFTISRKGFSAISPVEFPHYFWFMFILYGLFTLCIFYRVWKKYS
jgi:hypothetical protein